MEEMEAVAGRTVGYAANSAFHLSIISRVRGIQERRALPEMLD